MAKFRKTAALLACAIAASTATACSDTTYSLKAGDDEVKAGIYIGYLQNELSTQLNLLYYQGVTEDPFSHNVGDVSLSDYVKNAALKSTKEFLAIKKQFEAEGLTLTDEQLKNVNSSINETWKSNGDLYEYEGISKESMKELYKASLWSNAIFEAYYGEEGKEAPSAEELQKYVNDNYLRYKMIVLYKSSASDEETKKSENEAKLKERDEFLAKAAGVSFADFDQIIKEYEDYEAAKSAAESGEGTDDSSEGDPSSSAEDSSSEADASSAEESSTSDDSASSAESSEESATVNATPAADSESRTDNDSSQKEVSEASSEEPVITTGDDASSVADTSSESDDTSSEADSSEPSSTESAEDASSADESSADESEADPYKEEVMRNFDALTDSELESESGKLYKFIKDMEIGKATAFENENGYYIVIKADVSERSTYAADNRSTVVHEMKDDEYQAKIDSWVAALDIKVNDKAVKRYTPEVIYDRMNEYYKKNKS